MPGRHRTSAIIAFAVIALLHGCGERPLLRDPEGRFAVVAAIEADGDLAQAVTVHHPDLTVVCSSRLATTIAATAPQLAIVAVGERPEAAFTATAVPTDPATAALDLARLAALDDLPPQHLGLGARWYVAANEAAGGTASPSPGDFALRTLCLQEEAKLSVDRGASASPIGVVGRKGHPGHRSLLDAAATTRPDRSAVVIVAREVESDSPDAWRAALQQCARAGCRVAVVAIADAGLSAAARRETLDAGVKLVAVGDEPTDGHFTHWVGPDPETLGRALGAAIVARSPHGARLLEIRDDSARTERMLSGLHQALRLRAP